jgi:hypothetical protein
LDKERDFHKGYKHDVKNWRKNKAQDEQENKLFITKLQDENVEFKGSTTWLKSEDEKLQNLKQKVEIWETTERKWTNALLFIRNNRKLWIVK